MFSIKSTMYVNGHRKNIDGPWKPTFEVAVAAYLAKVDQKGLHGKLVFQPFVAEEAPKETASSGDGRRYYNTNMTLRPEMVERLTTAGLTVHG